MSSVLLATSACGRLGFAGDVEPLDAAPDAEPVRSVSAITGVSPIPDDIDLAVLASPSGFTAVWAPRVGGMMWGFNLDASMVPDADYRVTSSRTDYVQTTLTWTGTRMTTMTTNGPVTFIKEYVPNLSSYLHPDTRTGIATKPAYATVGGRWFNAVIDQSVLHVREMAANGTGIGLVLDVAGGATGPTYSGSFAAGGDGNLYAVWSHVAGVCAWAQITPTPLAATAAAVPGTCVSPQVVTTSTGAVAVFDADGQIATLELSSGTAVEILGPGKSPRVARAPDGTYRVAWRGPDGLAVGRASTFATDSLVVMPLEGVTAPLQVDAFELAERDGVPYLFAVDGARLVWTAL